MCGGIKRPQVGWVYSGRNGHRWKKLPDGSWKKIPGDFDQEFGEFEGNARCESCGLDPTAVKIGQIIQAPGRWNGREVIAVPALAVREYSQRDKCSYEFQVPAGKALAAVKAFECFAVLTREAPEEFKQKWGVERVPVLIDAPNPTIF